MWAQILPGLRIKIFMTILLGVIYPLAITGICQVIFPHQANGSLITVGGKVIGSEIIGQNSLRTCRISELVREECSAFCLAMRGREAWKAANSFFFLARSVDSRLAFTFRLPLSSSLLF